MSTPISLNAKIPARPLMFALLALASLLLAGCGGDDRSTNNDGTGTNGTSSNGTTGELKAGCESMNDYGPTAQARMGGVYCEKAKGAGTNTAKVSKCSSADGRMASYTNGDSDDHITAGSARVTVKDASGKTILDATIRSDSMGEVKFAESGDSFTITAVRSSDFAGSFQVNMMCSWQQQ